MIEEFRPLIDAVKGVDLTDPGAARAELEARFSSTAPEAIALNRRLLTLLEEGQLAQRGELPVRYGRVTKALPESDGYSIDVVVMNGPGPLHRHPNGEANYCVALEGSPTFMGQPPGWVVEPPGSQHVPTVEGGKMLIVYLLPEGAIEFVS